MAENFRGEKALKAFLLYGTQEILTEEVLPEELEDGLYKHTVTGGNWRLENTCRLGDNPISYRDRDLVWYEGSLFWFGFQFSEAKDSKLAEPLNDFLRKSRRFVDLSFPIVGANGFEDERFRNDIAPMVAGQLSLAQFVVVHKILDKHNADLPVVVSYAVGGLVGEEQAVASRSYEPTGSGLYVPDPRINMYPAPREPISFN